MKLASGRSGRKNRLGAVVASLAVAGLVLSACSSGGDEAATEETTAAETAATEEAASGEGPIRIGISLPLTGDFSQPGGAAKKGYEVWQTLTNQAGGMLGRDVELVILDDASSQEQVVTDYNRLINEEKVDLLLGTFSSLLNYPASAVAENNKYVLIAPAGGSPKIFEQNFKYYFFAQQAVGPDQGNEMVKYVESLPEAERPKTAAFVTQDDPFAAPVIEAMQAKMEALGVETVYSEIYPPETVNFQPIANAIAQAKPDFVAQGAVFEDGVNLIKSMVQLGFSPNMMFQTSAPSNGLQFSDAIGIANTEGIFYAVSWTEKADTPGNAEFVAEYQKQFGADLIPEEDAADAYAAAQVLQAAVEATGGLDNTVIQEWLHANGVTTILGDLSWDEIGRPQGEFLLAQWQNGEVEIVKPDAVATSTTVINPKPAWQ
jgi:branched-chain amino acid transport system substrate-binding protein